MHSHHMLFSEMIKLAGMLSAIHSGANHYSIDHFLVYQL
jgi:hypothetical protein